MLDSEQDRPDVRRRRAQWIKYRNRIEAERLVFIDETWTKTNMAPLRGWAPRGHRRKAIRGTGAKLFFLPKYSPDLNPIEQVFSKLKHLLRKAAPRTPETVCEAIGQLLDAYTPKECANYFTNAGYDLT